MGKVFLIASGKGGTGKSVFASNMGALLAQSGKSVVIIDTDMGLRTLDIYLGLESKVVYNAYDVMSGLCRIKQALVRDKRFDELYLMAGAPSKFDDRITPLHMKVLCRRLAEKFDYIIVDAPAGIDEGFYLSMAGADEAILVITPEYTAVRDAEKMNQLFSENGIKCAGYVINKVKPELAQQGSIPSPLEISGMLRMPLLGIIQFDDNIHIAANSGVPIVLKKDTYIYRNFKKIIERITGKL